MASTLQNLQTIMVDATNQIAGRLGSNVAELLLKGNRVVVLNAEKAVMSGRNEMVVREFLDRLKIKSAIHPKHAPRHPRTPDGIVTRMIRGMVPRRRPKGIQAMKRLRVYVGVPDQYRSAKKVVFEKAMIRKPIPFYTSLTEVAKVMGWKGE